MNILSILPKRMLKHILCVFIVCTLIRSTHPQIAKADAAPPPDPTVGAVSPYQPITTNVQMMSETVFIDVPRSPSDLQEPKQIRVNASFTMRNQGKTKEQMQVIFPLTRLNTWSTEEALYRIDPSSFVVKVKGKRAPFTTMTTPAEETISDDQHGFSPDVQWAAFEVIFPVQKDVLLEVEYEMLNPYGDYGEGFTGIAYILETGAGWYGNILSADITLRLPYRLTEEAIIDANPGYVVSGREMHWKLKNFEPTRKDNVEVKVIHVDIWQTILNLRERVENHPNDADAWANLGNIYMDCAIFTREGIFLGSNPHFTELALEARQKVVELRPQSGDAHYDLAYILWMSNPTIQNKLKMGAKSAVPAPSLLDPVIQKVLHELQLARSLGTTDTIDSLNAVFPELVLTESTIATVTLHPATETLILVPTNTVSPTVLPTFAPTLSPTLIPAVTLAPIPAKTSALTSGKLLILAIFIMAIGAGMLIYVRNIKRRE